MQKVLMEWMKKRFVFFFIQNHISELLNNIERNAKIFKKEEENKTNKKHFQKRKIVIFYINKIKKILGLFNYELKVDNSLTIKEKPFLKR